MCDRGYMYTTRTLALQDTQIVKLNADYDVMTIASA